MNDTTNTFLVGRTIAWSNPENTLPFRVCNVTDSGYIPLK